VAPRVGYKMRATCEYFEPCTRRNDTMKNLEGKRSFLLKILSEVMVKSFFS